MLFREICPHLKPNIKKKNNPPAAHKKHSTYKGKENQLDEVKKERSLVRGVMNTAPNLQSQDETFIIGL